MINTGLGVATWAARAHLQHITDTCPCQGPQNGADKKPRDSVKGHSTSSPSPGGLEQVAGLKRKVSDVRLSGFEPWPCHLCVTLDPTLSILWSVPHL